MYKPIILGIAMMALLVGASPAPAQWSPLKRISYARGGYNPHIMARGDTLHVVYQGLSSYNRTVIWHVGSIDGGNSWGTPQIVCDTTGSSGFTYPKVTCWGSRVAVFWKNNFRNARDRDNIGMRLSTNGGQTWGSVFYLLESNVFFMDHFDACSEDSVIDIVYCFASPGVDAYFLKYLRSTNFGITWNTPPDTICRSLEFGVLDMEKFGDRLNVIFTGGYNHQYTWEIYHFRSTDGGDSWSGVDSLTLIDNHSSIFPKMCTKEDGELLAVWTDFAPGPTFFTGDLLLRRSLDGGLSWTPSEQVTFTYYAWQSDVTAFGDSIFLAWSDDRHHSSEGISTVYSIHSTDDGLTWSPELRMEPESYDCVEPTLAHSNGKARLVFKDGRCEPDTDFCVGAYYTEFPAEPDKVEEEWQERLPGTVFLYSYPNPFNSSVLIHYDFENQKGGELGIYNIHGQRVRSIHLDGKEGQIEWDATDAKGNKVSSGIYFARAEASQDSYTIKLLYLK